MHQPAGHPSRAPGAARPTFSRAMLMGAVGAVLLTLVGAALARYAGWGTPTVPAGTPLLARSLSFEDQPDGSILVRDGAAEVAVLAPGGDVFIRGALRALVRERRQHAFGPGIAFDLAAWPDGRLTLTDPTTGRMLGLEAFGSTNAASFARLLLAREGTR